ncbi:hypothetical protein [Bradyrhizobium sp. CCGE-LA001]|uniref:hypothetical protein n=1 Tax=Bradyrhizobium sp. CCGE-LA001 TaxID=1223566 RepID=UPI001F4056D2|nr:hypothetical protein [Bradyrhizobium sp. CCGE-LA001]
MLQRHVDAAMILTRDLTFAQQGQRLTDRFAPTASSSRLSSWSRIPASCNRASIASSGSFGTSVAFFGRLIRSFRRSRLRIRQEDATTRAVETTRHPRRRNLRPKDCAVVPSNTIQMDEVDDPQPAPHRLLVDGYPVQSMADPHLAGRDRYR